MVVAAEVGSGLVNGHAADRVDRHLVQAAEPAIFQPQDAVGEGSQPFVVADDDYGALVGSGQLA
jgi:hypothetical protein